MITPVFREEFFLDAIINGTTPPDPIFRVEYFLAKIAGADVVTPTPIFRIEKYLAKICGEDVEIPDPVFREEYWLAKKCGENVTTPTPVFRLEYFLEEWVNGSAPAYQTVTGKIVSFLTQRIAPLKIEASLEPIQDLHGYDYPWPAGGGKNLMPPTIYNYAVSSGAVVENSDYRSMIAEVTGGVTYMLSRDVISGNRFRAYGTETAPSAGVPVTNIATSAGADSALSLQLDIPSGIKYILVYLANNGSTITSKMQLEKGLTVSAYTPYSNICPISGHTGADVVRTGKNLFLPNASGGASSNVAFVRNSDYSVTFTGKSNGTTRTPTIGDVTLPAGSYILSGVSGGSENSYGLRVSAWNGSSYSTLETIYGGEVQFTLAEETPIRLIGRFSNVQTTDYNVTMHPMIRLASISDSTYEPFSGTTVSITFGSTVYGGKITVNEDGSGSVKARPYYASYNGETLVGPWVSSMDAYAPGTTPTTGAQVVDMGGTETTISLTPGQVNALQGNNTVWVDESGEIKVTYQSN